MKKIIVSLLFLMERIIVFGQVTVPIDSSHHKDIPLNMVPRVYTVLVFDGLVMESVPKLEESKLSSQFVADFDSTMRSLNPAYVRIQGTEAERFRFINSTLTDFYKAVYRHLETKPDILKKINLPIAIGKHLYTWRDYPLLESIDISKIKSAKFIPGKDAVRLFGERRVIFGVIIVELTK